MIYESAKRYEEYNTKAPRVWVSMLGVFLSAVIMVAVAKIASNLYPKQSDFLTAEKAAAETYNQYLLRLENIEKEGLTELKAITGED